MSLNKFWKRTVEHVVPSADSIHYVVNAYSHDTYELSSHNLCELPPHFNFKSYAKSVEIPHTFNGDLRACIKCSINFDVIRPTVADKLVFK